MMINSKVAVIVVNWKKYDITSSCIESILNSTNSNFKIILVDNESDNKKVKNFKYRNEIEIIQNKKNEGFSKAIPRYFLAVVNEFEFIINLVHGGVFP